MKPQCVRDSFDSGEETCRQAGIGTVLKRKHWKHRMVKAVSLAATKVYSQVTSNRSLAGGVMGEF